MEFAKIAGLGRSTLTKQLTALRQAGDATATEGDRDGRGRTSTRWSHRSDRASPPAPGELDGLVIEHMRGLDAPVGPRAVGKALDRSVGAVANCMTRLAKSRSA